MLTVQEHVLRDVLGLVALRVRVVLNGVEALATRLVHSTRLHDALQTEVRLIVDHRHHLLAVRNELQAHNLVLANQSPSAVVEQNSPFAVVLFGQHLARVPVPVGPLGEHSLIHIDRLEDRILDLIVLRCRGVGSRR